MQLSKIDVPFRRYGGLLLAFLALGLVRRWFKHRLAGVSEQIARHEARRGDSRPRSNPAKGKGRGRDERPNSAHPPRGNSPIRDAGPWPGPALESEIGQKWHFEGHRRWHWLHDGKTVNGFVEFGRGGALRNSFNRPGTWRLRGADGEELVATFGNCHHTLCLVPDKSPPEFRMRERIVINGRPRDQRPPRTTGRLDMGH